MGGILMKYLVFSLLIIISAFTYGGTIDPDVEDSKYLAYGAKHKCVLPIMGILDDGLNSNFRGSCVMIDEYHILTAAHIVADSITQHVIYNNEAYSCRIVAIHSKYDRKKMGIYDIAIAKLQKPIKLDFYPELYSSSDEKGKICSIAGYGYTGNFKTGYNIKKYDNKKRAGSNIISSIENDVLVFNLRDNPQTTLEFMICPGDSGGGLFIDNKLAGINSFIYAKDGNANANYNDSGCSTRISVYTDWIEDTKEIIGKIDF